jgi:hypothetical protein
MTLPMEVGGGDTFHIRSFRDSVFFVFVALAQQRPVVIVSNVIHCIIFIIIDSISWMSLESVFSSAVGLPLVVGFCTLERQQPNVTKLPSSLF